MAARGRGTWRAAAALAAALAASGCGLAAAAELSREGRRVPLQLPEGLERLGDLNFGEIGLVGIVMNGLLEMLGFGPDSVGALSA